MPLSTPKLDAPLLLAPEFKDKIWGCERLDPLYPEAVPGKNQQTSPSAPRGAKRRKPAAGRLIGEAWLTGERATFVTGPVAGLTLEEVCRRWPAELCGSGWKADYFPFLAKFLFTSDWLSMQVHPDDDYAWRHEKSRGKTEAWYVLERDRSAEIALGLLPATNRATLKAACRRGQSREVVQLFRPKQGEAVFVPSGTIHALGPGLVLFELSETSDVTYRLDDYGRLDDRGRPRDLHLERGLESVRFEGPAHRGLPHIEFEEPFGTRRYVVACSYFAIEALALDQRWSFKASADRVEALAMLRGEGRVETEKGWLAYAPGQAWLVPPGAAPYRLVPEKASQFIRCYVPDLDRDFRLPLARQGVSADVIRQIVFDH